MEARVNDKLVLNIEREQNTLKINGVKSDVSVEFTAEDRLDLVFKKDGTAAQKTAVQLLAVDHDAKTVHVKVKGNTYVVQLKSDFDRLLEQLGMGPGSSAKLNSIKAPMPGMVLDVMVGSKSRVPAFSSMGQRIAERRMWTRSACRTCADR